MPNPWQEPFITSHLVGLPVQAGHGYLQILLKTVFTRQVQAQGPPGLGQDADWCGPARCPEAQREGVVRDERRMREPGCWPMSSRVQGQDPQA